MASKPKAAPAGAPTIKIGLFGHGASGKTALAIQFVQSRFIEDYEPSCASPIARSPCLTFQSAMTTRSP